MKLQVKIRTYRLLDLISKRVGDAKYDGYYGWLANELANPAENEIKTYHLKDRRYKFTMDSPLSHYGNAAVGHEIAIERGGEVIKAKILNFIRDLSTGAGTYVLSILDTKEQALLHDTFNLPKSE